MLSNIFQYVPMYICVFFLHVLTGFWLFKSIIILIKFIDLLYTIWVYKSVVKAYEWSHHWLDEQMFEQPPPATPGKASPRSQRTRAGFEDHAGTKMNLAGWKTVCSPGGDGDEEHCSVMSTTQNHWDFRCFRCFFSFGMVYAVMPQTRGSNPISWNCWIQARDLYTSFLLGIIIYHDWDE